MSYYRERERERERAKLLQLESSCFCSEISWQDTPTPSENKSFDFPPKGFETSSSEIPVQINKETQTTPEIDHQSFREQATKNFINLSQIWNKATAESQQKHQLFWINLVNKNHQKFLDYQKQTSQQISNLENQLKNEEYSHQATLITLNSVIRKRDNLQAENEELKEELTALNTDNSSLNIQLTQTKQQRDNYKKQLDTHTCSCSHNDYDTLKTQLAKKHQKIKELEQIIKELRAKPPANPASQEPKPNESKNETNNFLLEKEQLLSTIRQQKNTIQELQTKLKNANEKEPMVVFKEVPKVDLITIQQLKNEVKIRDRAIILLLIVSGVIVILLMLNTMRLLTKKSRKK